MEKSTVYVSMRDDNGIDCSYAIVDKGEKSVIIILKDLECAIYDYDYFLTADFNYHYLLLKHYDDDTSAYRDFMKLIGKMCKKSIDSKYFRNHIIENNQMIFSDDNHEQMVSDEVRDVYSRRVASFNEFIKNNKDRLIK